MVKQKGTMQVVIIFNEGCYCIAGATSQVGGMPWKAGGGKRQKESARQIAGDAGQEAGEGG